MGRDWLRHLNIISANVQLGNKRINAKNHRSKYNFP
jgi:hypothetical protein